MRSLVPFVLLSAALSACSSGESDIDQRFAEACANTPMLQDSEPCRNPDILSDERKEEMIERMGELDEGIERMGDSLDAAVEEARREAEAAQTQ